ncbi:MAG: hypothetical protein GXY43_02735 [Clostridiaceae bacterium]|nr:hypothetical protein [Clostridiaceae bacterium]
MTIKKESEDKKRAQGRKTTNRILPWLIFVSLLLVIAVGILVFLVKNHAEAGKGSDLPIGAYAISGFDCDFSEAQRIHPFADGLLKVTATRVVFLSLSGNEIYSYDMSMEDPICVISGGTAFVADQAGFSYASFGAHGKIFSGSAPGNISFSTLSESGYAALIIEEKNANGAVMIIDPSGTVIAKWQSVESGYPVSLAFSPNGSLLSVSLVNTDGSHMQPNLKQLFIPDSSLGERPRDHAFVTPEYSGILPSISYKDEDRLLWSGISDVFFLSQGVLTRIDASFPNIISVVPAGGNTGILYSDGIGKQIKIGIVDNSLNVLEPVVLGNQIKSFSVFEKWIIVAVDDRLLLIDTNSCTIEKERAVDEDIIRLRLSSKDRAVIVTSSGVREIRLS